MLKYLELMIHCCYLMLNPYSLFKLLKFMYYIIPFQKDQYINHYMLSFIIFKLMFVYLKEVNLS